MLLFVLLAIFAPAVMMKWPRRQFISETPFALNMAFTPESNWTYTLMFDSKLAFTLLRPPDNCLSKYFNNVVRYHFVNGKTNCLYEVIWRKDNVFVNNKQINTKSDVKVTYKTDMIEVFLNNYTERVGSPSCPYDPKDYIGGGAEGILTLNFTTVASPESLPCRKILFVFDENVKITDPEKSTITEKSTILWMVFFIVVCAVLVIFITLMVICCFCYYRGIGCFAPPDDNSKPMNLFKVESGAGSALGGSMNGIPASGAQTKAIGN